MHWPTDSFTESARSRIFGVNVCEGPGRTDGALCCGVVVLKGVSFLTTLGLTEEVAAVVDINPYKQGKFVPATGHEVIAPTALSDIRPDLVIVMNPIYENEVAANLRAMNLRSEVIALKPHCS